MANGSRSTVRKLGQNGGGSGEKGVSCGAEELVSGGMPPEENGQPPKGAKQDYQGGSNQGGSNQGGSNQGGSNQGGSNQGGSQSPKGLQQASAEVLTALHAAKEELAAELDANLKQLKTVLEETQRIQRQMEAVLNEARNSPNLQEKATGQGDQKGSGGWQAQAGGRRNSWKAPVKLGTQNGSKVGQAQKEQQGAAGQEAGGQEAGGRGTPQGGNEQEQKQPPQWDQLQVGASQAPAWEPPHLGPTPAGAPQGWQIPPEATPPQAQQ